MPAGAWIGVAFFFLLTAAALASAVSLLEVPVAIATRLGVPRAAASVGLAAVRYWAPVAMSVFLVTLALG